MFRILFLLLSFVLLLTSCSQKKLSGDLLIKNVHVIDVETGVIDYAMNVLIRADSIATIHVNSAKVEYLVSSTVDGTDQYLIPGLWDMHVHTWWIYEDFFPLLIGNGIVGIREMHGNREKVQEMKNRVEQQSIIGPQVISAGPIVDGNPPSRDDYIIANSPEEGRAIVRQQKQDGADFIKVYFNLKKEVYLAIADECKKQGIPLAGHLPNKVPLTMAIAAGHQTFDHLYNIPATIANQAGLSAIEKKRKGRFVGPAFYDRFYHVNATYDTTRIDSLLNIFKESTGIYLCPTFTIHKGFQRDLDPNYLGDHRLHYMPESFVTDWLSGKKQVLSKNQQRQLDAEFIWYNRMIKLIKPLSESGVRFLAGTDYPGPFVYPGFSLHEELEIFVREAGFSTLEALQTATLNAAKFLKKSDQYGTITAGKKASLLILDENPLENIQHTQAIAGLVLEGKYFDKKSLKAMLGSKKRKK